MNPSSLPSSLTNNNDNASAMVSTTTTSSSSSASNNNTPSIQEQLASYREKHRIFKEKKRNHDMASLTGFLIASKYDPYTTLPSCGLERVTFKPLGYSNTLPSNSTKSAVSFRGKACGFMTPSSAIERKQVQVGSWFKPSINENDDDISEQVDSPNNDQEQLENNIIREEVIVSSSNTSSSAFKINLL
ncbi:hypothetical protein C9374_008163 [Naegleria lovaniensis]|uniref:Uncharacterized protein n=1 Tax=Naegleria lovaniensis TaxID=51637 RepID=A0AA88KL62_NAELO|nr:uncharacterized protein C9374_008163 [Naegleria lovaniensis]KAG2378524.1 hypothetical protein C9374_008163 [Naegleria lovaniensis]